LLRQIKLLPKSAWLLHNSGYRPVVLCKSATTVFTPDKTLSGKWMFLLR